MKKKIGVIAAIVTALLLLLAVILWLSVDRTDTVGICYRDSDSTENAAYRQQLKNALTARGFAVIEKNAGGDQAKQLGQIEALAQEKCDVLLIEPVMADAAEDLLAAISRTELPAVLVDRRIDTALLESYPQVTYIGTEESQIGQLQAKMMEQLPAGGDLNGDGIVSYMLIAGPQDHQDAASRTESFENALLSGSLKVQQLAKEWGDHTQDSGRRLCKQQLAVFGKDIEVIVCGNDQMAAGAAQAVTDGGRTVGKDVYLLAIGGEGEILKMVSEGKASGTVYSDPAVQISAITEAVIALHSGQPAKQIQILPYTTVTAENVKQYLENEVSGYIESTARSHLPRKFVPCFWNVKV